MFSASPPATQSLEFTPFAQIDTLLVLFQQKYTLNADEQIEEKYDSSPAEFDVQYIMHCVQDNFDLMHLFSFPLLTNNLIRLLLDNADMKKFRDILTSSHPFFNFVNLLPTILRYHFFIKFEIKFIVTLLDKSSSLHTEDVSHRAPQRYDLDNLLQNLSKEEAESIIDRILKLSLTPTEMLDLFPVLYADDIPSCNKLAFQTKLKLIKSLSFLTSESPEDQNLCKKAESRGLSSLSIEELYHLKVLLPSYLRIKENIQSEIFSRNFSAESQIIGETELDDRDFQSTPFLIIFMIKNLALFKEEFLFCYFTSPQFEEDNNTVSIGTQPLLLEVEEDKDKDEDEREEAFLKLIQSSGFRDGFFSAAQTRNNAIQNVLSPILCEGIINIVTKGYEPPTYHLAIFNKLSEKESEVSSSATVGQPLVSRLKL